MPSECCKKTWAKISDDEPVFILRGKDPLAPAVLLEWIGDAERNNVNFDKVERARLHLEAFEIFQREHPERCKLPD